MKAAPSQTRRPSGGFSLVEMMTALLVLSLLVVLMAQLFSSASILTKASTARLDADTEARLVFDRMADDLTWMLRRPDVDFHFVKQPDNGTNPPSAPYSDTCFFFSEVPGYYSSSETLAESNAALIGYRINSTTYQMERLARGLAWDSDGSTAGVPLVFLTFNNYSGPVLTDYTPAYTSTILGAFPETPALDQPGNTDPYFHVLGDSVFRLEFCFFLKDGTYSVVPAMNYAPLNSSLQPTSSTTVSNNLDAAGPPAPSNGYSTYGVGSRWYDTQNNHGYICTSAPANGSATWRPLGMADVQAVVVTIAILDQTTRKLISGNSTALPNMAKALVGPTWSPATGALSTPPVPTIAALPSSPPNGNTPLLMAQTWQATVNLSTFPTTTGVPKAAASQVRVYQRFFYLNNNL